MSLLLASKSNKKSPKNYYQNVKKRTSYNFQGLKVKICGKWLKDLASALSVFPTRSSTRIPHNINHAVNNDANQWFRKPLRKFQKENTRITSFFIGVLAGTHLNKACTICSTFSEALERFLMSRFLWERNITFWMKLRSTLWKEIAMLLMTVSLICSVPLLHSTNHIKKKHGMVKSVKYHSTGWFI